VRRGKPKASVARARVELLLDLARRGPLSARLISRRLRCTIRTGYRWLHRINRIIAAAAEQAAAGRRLRTQAATLAARQAAMRPKEGTNP
jgi:hypothetical protein